ncbi:hypothetical protein FOZ62_017893 [Perkinsus olseni]|uniref:Uncharacterized protein n=1 Tax=Perkinsus olseni TaxID=32597 RepID=A0A7J6PPS6_PEROL|nr:hypothetical protein FOZ62_017893 [Perkinsus olseni]
MYSRLCLIAALQIVSATLTNSPLRRSLRRIGSLRKSFSTRSLRSSGPFKSATKNASHALREKVWTWREDVISASPVLESNQLEEKIALVGATVGVTQGTDGAMPLRTSLFMNNQYQGRYQIAVHYLSLGRLSQRLPKTNMSTAMETWATYFSSHPSKDLKTAGPFAKMKKRLERQPKAYAPLMVAYGLHTVAQTVLRNARISTPINTECFSNAPVGQQFYINAHSEKGKPCLRVDLYFDRYLSKFEVFSLYQDTEGTRFVKLAALDANAIGELTAPFEKMEFEIYGQIHLHERGKSLSAAHPEKAKKFGLEWYDGASDHVKNGKAIVLIHAVACGWPPYLKGYKFNETRAQ